MGIELGELGELGGVAGVGEVLSPNRTDCFSCFFWFLGSQKKGKLFGFLGCNYSRFLQLVEFFRLLCVFSRF